MSTKILEKPGAPVTEAEDDTDIELELPPPWKVILINDNVTPFEYVVAINRDVFGLDTRTAIEIMRYAHNHGRCVVVTTTKEEASSYLESVDRMKRELDCHELTYIAQPDEESKS